MLGTRHILRAHYSCMVAVLYIYIFKCVHLYKLCIMHGMSETYTSLLYNTRVTVVHTRISFSAGSLIALRSMCSIWDNWSARQIIFPIHSSLEGGSEFPFVIWKFPEVSVLTKPLFPGTMLHISLTCVEQSQIPHLDQEWTGVTLFER